MSARNEPTTFREAIFNELDTPGSITKNRIRNLLIRYPERGPRTITTAEELDALATGSVILDDDESAAVKVEADRWELSGFSSTFRTDAIDLPAAVLYEPAP